MVAIAPDRAAASQGPIDRLCQPHREALASVGEPGCAICLHEKMHVIVLDTEMKDAERGTRDGDQGAADGIERAAIAERGDARRGPQGDVNREARIVLVTAPLGYHAPFRSGGASRARAATAPRTKDECSLSAATHLNEQRLY
jgi:hypothetical protein